MGHASEELEGDLRVELNHAERGVAGEESADGARWRTQRLLDRSELWSSDRSQIHGRAVRGQARIGEVRMVKQVEGVRAYCEPDGFRHLEVLRYRKIGVEVTGAAEHVSTNVPEVG